MYSFNSNAETSQHESSFLNQNKNCTAVDRNTGELCGETESLRILDEFQKLYESRIEKVDQEFVSEFERVSMKLQIMKEWVRDLGEQNAMLVHTVEDLEQTACNRVQLLEEKLKQSSTIVSRNITKSNHTEEAINLLSTRVSELEKDEEYMQQKVEFLQSDIRGLLELIRRGTQENQWSLDGIAFFEIQPNDIPLPLNCPCGQEEIDNKLVQSLKLEIEQLQDNERKMIKYQTDLEKKLSDLTTKLTSKESKLETYVSQLQSFNGNLKKHSKTTDRDIYHSLDTNAEQYPDIVIMGDTESMLVEKDLEMKSLRQQFQSMESNLMMSKYDNNVDLNSLKVQLSEKSKELQEVRQQMTNLQEECIEAQKALSTEVTEQHIQIMSLRKQVLTLKEECHYASLQIQFKEDIIKKMRKELKQATMKDVHISLRHDNENVCVNKSTFQEDYMIECWNKIKFLMEKEKQAVLDLKMELRKVIEKLHFKEKEGCHYDTTRIYEKLKDIEALIKNCKIQVNDYPESVEDFMKKITAIELQVNNLKSVFQSKSVECWTSTNDFDLNSIVDMLNANIERVTKMNLEKENILIMIDSLMNAQKNICSCDENVNNASNTNICQQFKLMKAYMSRFVAAQESRKTIKQKISDVISTFNSRHKKYTELNDKIIIMQELLSKTWERIMETISRLQLQENERLRYEKRIVSGKIRLKDIKNEINHAQSRLSCCIADMEENMQDHTTLNHTDICTCNDMLDLAIEEIEKISRSLNICQTQGCCVTPVLEELRDHLFDIEASTKELRKTMDEAVFEHTITETTFNEKEEQLETFEIEDDALNTNMYDTLKMLFSTTVHNQKLDEILQTQDLCTLKKEYDDLKKKLSQASYADCDGKMYEWKNRMIDLQDQIKMLQLELKCKEEANDMLKNSIELMEEELHSTQTKADNYRRSHSIDSMELKKKIVELENTIKTQRETEHSLRQHLNESELELKQSKEVLNSFHSEHGVEGILLRYGCNHFKHDTMNIPQLFKTLQNVMQSTKCGLQSLKDELKKMVCDGSPNSCLSTRLIMGLIDKLQKYEEELNNCTQDVDKLKDALYSKDKLLENMDEIIKIQKDSIAMTQTELKELHQRLQEKIDTQDRAIAQYEAEKRELLKQNELQIQTIGHLQNAVVEAKRCIDQMGHKTMSDLQEKTETIRLLTICVDETETQYSECFAEAAEQDKLLELQRDAINGLQEKIYHMEHRTPIIVSFIHNMYYTILTFIQEQLQARVNDFQALKCKVETLIQSKSYLENKYKNVKTSWRETEEKLQELMKITLHNKRETKVYDNKACQCKVELKHKECMVQSTELSFNDNLMSNTEEQMQNVSHEHELQSEIDTLIRENEDVKKQLQKWILDFDIIDEELKIEKKNDAYAEQIMGKLKIMKNTECALRFENDQLKFDLQKQTKEMEDLWGELQYVKEKNVKFEKLVKKMEEKQIEINCLHNQIACNETVIRGQKETIQELEERLKINKQQTENYLHQLHEGEDMLAILRDRIHSIKAFCKEKSDDMAKLQADYETLKNDNSILKKEGIIYENKAKDEICKLKKQLKHVQLQLCLTEDNYHSVTQDFNKIQEQLVKAVKQEADLQGSLTITEENCNSKLMTAEKEKLKLGDLIAKLNKELEDTQRNYSSKSSEYCKLQDICKSYIQQIDTMKQHIMKEREKAIKVEESNRCLMQQLQECIKENCSLVQEKASIEQNNYKVTTELHDVYKSLLDLREECLMKKKSLVSISADLTQIAMTKSELCNESQYLVSCIRIWMEEQKKHMDNLIARLKFKQQRLLQLGFERKALLVTIKELRRVNSLLTQRLKRAFKPGKGVRSSRTKCYFIPSTALQNFSIRVPLCSNSSRLQKVSRRASVSGNPWWFPKMEYLVNKLRKNNICHNENSCGESTETALEESHDCGYQSSTSK